MKPAKLSDDAQAAFARMKANERAYRLYCEARRNLDKEFGKANLGALPDGTLIARTEVPLSKQMSQFNEILPWDA